MPNAIKLKSGFEGVWSQSFHDLEEIGEKAWILRLFFRVHTNQTTRLCNPYLVKERDLQNEFGWDRKTIRKAKKKLLELGYIVNTPEGLYVRHGYILSTESTSWGKNSPKSLGEKVPHLGGKIPQTWGKKSPALGEKFPHHINNTEPEQHNHNSNVNNLGNKNEILKTIGKDFNAR